MEDYANGHFVDEWMDCLGDVVYCAKDAEGIYTAVNHTFVERIGLKDKGDVIGKKAADLFPAHLARVYEEQDRQVIQSGQPLHDQLELISHSDGSLGWYLASKFPLRDADGTVSGIVGLSQDLRTPSDSDLELSDLKTVVDYIHEHLDASLRTDALAELVGLSAMQLDRRMRRVFRLSTKKYVMKCRLDRATRLLVGTEDSLAGIALACGFSDQSAFTRQFCSAANETPLAYRKARRNSP